ncbi:RND family transporter [Mycobacterium sp. SMC-16]|uniref:MMPL/RND family transporter n=1 Tax=Mycobacteriaceae TaxID=1762 RepID=UPI00226AB7C8|nr:RND family transporter [Mycolicibacterium mucogenicum]MCX8557604.1 RND family transporter [Mycolicibacterium mucogenicum]
MLKRARPSGALAHAGFAALGKFVVRRPVMILVTWVGLAAVLFLAIPPLVDVSSRHPPDFLPPDSATLIAGNAMKNAFREADAGNVAIVLLTNDKGFSKEDEDVYRRLVDKLNTDKTNVKSTQDFIHIPELRQVMVSKDGKAVQLPVSLVGNMGTAPGQAAYTNAMETVQQVVKGSDLTLNVVGAAATFQDIAEIGAHDQHMIEATTGILVFSILIIVYRSLVAMLLPLFTIGVSLIVAQQVVAGLGLLGLGLGPQTMVLMTGMMLGAGTDYAIFLFSRYQEFIRQGATTDQSLVLALTSIGEVIAGSAGTVAVTFLALSFATLGVFATIGPALSVTILIGFIASVTMLPALIVLVGRRGWIKPRKDMAGRFWRRSGVNIVRRPVTHLAGSLAVLLALAGCATLVRYNYDNRKDLDPDAASNVAYETLNKHFPVSTTMQQFVLIQSPRDLRAPRSLADMEQMAQRIAQLPHIDSVRGITRPTGDVLEQAKATYQAGEVGSKLKDASNLINGNDALLQKLVDGEYQLADALNQIRTQVLGGIGPVRQMLTQMSALQKQYGGSKTLEDLDKSAKMISQMTSLGDAVGGQLVRVGDVYKWSGKALETLNATPFCNYYPACNDLKIGLQNVNDGNDPETVQKVINLGHMLQQYKSDPGMDDKVRGMGTNIESITSLLKQLRLYDTADLERRLQQAVDGVNLLADSSKQLADGVKLLVDQVRGMGGGLNQASSFLLGMRRDANTPQMAGFYVPPEILSRNEFEKAATLFVSPDGHTVRYLVQTALNPFGTEAMDQTNAIVKAAETALPNTTLSDAKVSMIGLSAVNRDIRDYYNSDIQFIVIVTLIVVFLILVQLLRSVVAPLYLVLSVVLSYGSALGIGVVFFQFILGYDISWSVPGIAFLVLVAVGADYNLLLISRIRDEAKYGVRSAIVKTVAATGGVITSAGLIFAASMLAMTVSSILGAVQLGFIIGIGLLLDTFIVRTITVPATAALLGDANWWPSKSPRRKREDAEAALAEAEAERRAAERRSRYDSDDPEPCPECGYAATCDACQITKAFEVAGAAQYRGGPFG